MKQLSTSFDWDVLAKTIRLDILSMSYQAQSAHVGGALSCVEILLALYFGILRIDPKHPSAMGRDRLVFSKGHDAKALYAVLARRGYFPVKLLATNEQNDSKLATHPTAWISGVDASTGSLGHGLSVGVGMALGQKNQRLRIKTKVPRVFVVLSDGECDEGSTWEAALFAGHHELENLIAIVDYNKLQGFGFTEEVLDLEPFADKWESFGWSVVHVDGHSIEEIQKVCLQLPFVSHKPSVIVAHTIKGQGGVPAHISQISSQYKPPTKAEFEALKLENK